MLVLSVQASTSPYPFGKKDVNKNKVSRARRLLSRSLSHTVALWE